LLLEITYPYTDDVLLRGNSATLRHLGIKIDKNTVNVLSKCQVFISKYKNRVVHISKSSQPDELALVSDADMDRFICNLVGAAQMLSLTSWMPVSRLVVVAPPAHGFMCLKALEVRLIDLTLFDILRLLKVLPNLVKLTCGFGSLGSELEDIAAKDLPNYVASTFSNTGKNLQIISN
ncbi:hypothetical protein GGH92_005086, partial [Coemansia sp. RSA 2673]